MRPHKLFAVKARYIPVMNAAASGECYNFGLDVANADTTPQ
jgi:hypothetical protein